jgi:anti-sigma factor RsiW
MHADYREWIDLELDGELQPARRAELERHLAGCGECRAEREAAAALRAELAAARLAVRPDFTAAVMAALPPTGWEARSWRAWKAPAALAAGCAAAAAGLVAWRAGGLEPGAPLLGAAWALVETLLAALLAGSGLLAASWRGVGMAVADLFAGSWTAVGAFALGVAALNLLLVRLLRRRAPAAAPSSGSGARRDAR